jgi:hypothetical protein
VYAENTIGVDSTSAIDGDGAAGVSAASLTLTADDTSTINSLAGAISLAGGFGGVGAALAIGVSLRAQHDHQPDDTYILDADGDTAERHRLRRHRHRARRHHVGGDRIGIDPGSDLRRVAGGRGRRGRPLGQRRRCGRRQHHPDRHPRRYR